MPRKSDRILKLESDIAYEEAPGVHSYHRCECGNSTRSGKCAACLRKDLESCVQTSTDNAQR
jgi:hypothetical protein